MITGTVKLPEQLDARLRRRKQAQKLTYSEAVRLAFDEGLRQETAVNLFEALHEFVGSVDGPEDLSTNKSYMDDFGGRKRGRFSV